jgi:hypothetical protein
MREDYFENVNSIKEIKNALNFAAGTRRANTNHYSDWTLQSLLIWRAGRGASVLGSALSSMRPSTSQLHSAPHRNLLRGGRQCDSAIQM